MAALGDLRAAAGASIALMLAAAAAYAVVVWSLARHERTPAEDRRLALLLVSFAVVLRIALLTTPPTLSDDIYRYRWDGRVQAAGINPYAEPPAAVALEPLRDDLWSGINYPRIRSIYPPLAQVLFAAAYRIDDSLLSFKLLALAGDALTLVALWWLAACWRLPAWVVAVYALHPSPVLEYASSGHYDGWATAAVLLALLAHARGRALTSTLALAAGVLLKVWPIVLVPLLLRRRPPWHLAAFGGVVIAAWLPFLAAGAAPLQPWLEYAGRWRFNDGAFWVLQQATDSLSASKALAAMIGIGLLAWLWRRGEEPVRGGYWLLLAFIALAPTVHPWYMLWALPLAALAMDAGWLLLCALSPLAYAILVGAGPDSSGWAEPWWPRFAEYVPAAAVWVWQARRYGAPAPGRLRSLRRDAAGGASGDEPRLPWHDDARPA